MKWPGTLDGLNNNNDNNNNNNNDNLCDAVRRPYRYKGALQATTNLEGENLAEQFMNCESGTTVSPAGK